MRLVTHQLKCCNYLTYTAYNTQYTVKKKQSNFTKCKLNMQIIQLNFFRMNQIKSTQSPIKLKFSP